MNSGPQRNSDADASVSSSSNSRPKEGNDIEKAAEIKEWLEAKISELEAELKHSKDMLSLVDATLREKSFVPAIELRNSSSAKAPMSSVSQKPLATKDVAPVEQRKEVAPTPSQVAPQSGTPSEPRQLRRKKDSMLLASATVDPQRVVIVLAKDIKLSQRTPPFESFFINRILRGYQSKDEESSKNGKLDAALVLQYTVQESEGSISSVIVTNYRDTIRLNEILSTITWAFTQMLEKKQ